MHYLGVDGCRAGWLTVALDAENHWAVSIYEHFDELWHRWRGAKQILVDIPIGLRETGDERICDREARTRIGARRSSVFPAPCRAALAARSYEEASYLNKQQTGRGLSKQSFSLIPKIREVDVVMRADPIARQKVHEVHPELLFWSMNDGTALEHAKRTEAGQDERLAILEKRYPKAREVVDYAQKAFRRHLFGSDDVVDGLAAAVVARFGDGAYESIPREPERDAHGLPMAMLHAPASK
jgi:predicted RNase H-like nuclease